MNSEGHIVVGRSAQVELFVDPDNSLGPFATTMEAMEQAVALYLDMCSSGELGTTCANELFLTLKWRLQLCEHMSGTGASAQFYLKHVDDKGDHLLVDDDFNITGIIDWEMASVEAEGLAFSSPCMLWPVQQFYEGVNLLSPEEQWLAAALVKKDQPHLAGLVRSGRLQQRLWFFLSPSYDRNELIALFDGLRRATANSSFETELTSFEDWEKGAVDDAMHDPRYRRLVARLRRQQK